MSTPEADTAASAAFESRRHALWRGSRGWLLASLLAGALAAVQWRADGGEPPWTLLIAAGAVGAITVRRIIRGLDALYRCPGCGTQPYQTLTDYKCGGLGPSRADFMSPHVCPKCGRRLR